MKSGAILKTFVVGLFVFGLITGPLASRAAAEVITYELTIEETPVDFTGKKVMAMTVNGRIPAPTLKFTEGDTLRAVVHNKLKESSSIHWHGLLLPNIQDGVPHVTTHPIAPGGTHVFEFELKHAGTYWYHSHSGVQEQRGVYGAIVVQPRDPQIQVDHELVMVLSDWIDEDGKRVLRNLRKDGDHYAWKKDSFVSWWDAIRRGKFWQMLKGEWQRMPPMDVSDIGYDVFLINGISESELSELQPEQTIRLRVINAGASTYFHLGYGGGPLQLIAADGMDVQPVNVTSALVGNGETYDFLVTLPHHGAPEFRATAQDGTGRASVFLGTGHRMLAPDMPKPDPFDHGSGGHGGGHDGHDPKPPGDGHGGHEPGEPGGPGEPGEPGEPGDGEPGEPDPDPSMLEYSMLASPVATKLPEGRPWREIPLTLTGDMERFIWTFNNRALSESDYIRIKKGENVRFVLKNETMMHHPIHLHGHFFRLVNGKGDYAPLKHTVDVGPMKTVTIEFAADEEKDWLFHCHNLYHMATGMTRIIRYDNPPTGSGMIEIGERPDHRGHEGETDWVTRGELELQTNRADVLYAIFNLRNTLELRAKMDTQNGNWEAEAAYLRYRDRFLSFLGVVGMEAEEGRDVTAYAGAGVQYLLPLLIEARAAVTLLYDGGNVTVAPLIELEKFIALTDRLFLVGGLEWKKQEVNWSVAAEYLLVANRLLISAGYDSESSRPWGIGGKIRF